MIQIKQFGFKLGRNLMEELSVDLMEKFQLKE